MELSRPVFIGGTGRSGTSLMGTVLNSHPALCMPCHENKLIVERGGLKDIVARLSGRYDITRNHFTIHDFITRAVRMRHFGFVEPALNHALRQLRQERGLGFQEAYDVIQRANPQAQGAIHAIGQGFGVEHYDLCLQDFVGRITAHGAAEGVVDTDGLLKPFFIARTFPREAILAECRVYLDRLYTSPLIAANAARWVDDTPQNCLYFDFLYELYPDMKFIHMIRNPGDVIASYINQVWSPSDPALAASMVAGMIRSYRAVKQGIPPDRVLEVRLEDLVADREEALERIAAFLGVDNRFAAHLISPQSANIGRRHGSFDTATTRYIEKELGDWIRVQGYELD